MGLVMSPPIKNEARKKAIILRRLKYGLTGSCVIAAACLSFVIIYAGIHLASGQSLIEANKVTEPTTREDKEWTINNNIDTVCLLDENEWSKLNEQEKLDMLGVIANIETRYLGINHELHVKSAVLEGDTLASYSDMDYEILIDIEHLRSSAASAVLNSLCHECYHSYQHQLVELYNSIDDEYKNMLVFQYVDIYAEEFNNYNDSSEFSEEYYNQTIEKMARRYSAKAVIDYYSRIEEYASGG